MTDNGASMKTAGTTMVAVGENFVDGFQINV